jgi:hypothetical protein
MKRQVMGPSLTSGTFSTAFAFSSIPYPPSLGLRSGMNFSEALGVLSIPAIVFIDVFHTTLVTQSSSSFWVDSIVMPPITNRALS